MNNFIIIINHKIAIIMKYYQIKFLIIQRISIQNQKINPKDHQEIVHYTKRNSFTIYKILYHNL